MDGRCHRRRERNIRGHVLNDPAATGEQDLSSSTGPGKTSRTDKLRPVLPGFLFFSLLLVLVLPFQGFAYPRGDMDWLRHPLLPLSAALAGGSWAWAKGTSWPRSLVAGGLLLFNLGPLWAVSVDTVSGALTHIDIGLALTSGVATCTSICVSPILADTWLAISMVGWAYVFWPTLGLLSPLSGVLVFYGVGLWALGRSGTWVDGSWETAPMALHLLGAASTGIGIAILDRIGGGIILVYLSSLLPSFAGTASGPIAYPTPWQDPSMMSWIAIAALLIAGVLTWRWKDTGNTHAS